MRDIRFKPDRALWREEKLPVRADVLPPGPATRPQAVRINEIVGGQARRCPLQARGLRLRQEQPAVAAEVGRRRLCRLPRALRAQQRQVQGRAGRSSWARATSARSAPTSITACPRAAWPSTPSAARARNSRASRVLDRAPHGRRHVADRACAAGLAARQRRLHLRDQPGAETVVETRARLFLRSPVATLAPAPLTSMYLFGENQPQKGDFRPEVHDSDGLMVASASGEWMWRPLINPKRHADDLVHAAGREGLRPDAARPPLRQLRGHRGALRDAPLRLGRADQRLGSGPRRADVSWPTPDETNDNIVAYWVPATAVPAPGQPLDILVPPALAGRAAATPARRPGPRRRARGRSFAKLDPTNEQQFVVDFDRPVARRAARRRRGQAPSPAPMATARSPRSTPIRIRPTAAGAWPSASSRIRPGQSTELRGFLQTKQQVLDRDLEPDSSSPADGARHDRIPRPPAPCIRRSPRRVPSDRAPRRSSAARWCPAPGASAAPPVESLPGPAQPSTEAWETAAK